MQPISRQHVMSPTAQAIAKKVLEQLSKHPNEEVSVPTANLKSGKIAFSELGNYKFSYQGFDLYSLDSEDTTVPTIWKKETFKDPKTGTEMEWLVAYTTDDDDIARNVLSSQKASPKLGYYTSDLDNFIPKGSRVTDISTGKEGVTMGDSRPGIDKRVAVLWDGFEYSTFVDPKSLTMSKSTTPSSMASQKTASANAALRAVAEPRLPKNQPPIAPGVVNKNLTIDQGGQGGKATVTVDFNDPAKGEDFFKQIEDITSDMEGTTTAPSEVKEQTENPEQGLPESGNKEKAPNQAQPTPTPAGTPMGQPAAAASTIQTLTHYGSKVVTIIAEKSENYPEKYYFINEDGYKIALNLSDRVKVGSQIVRPDNNEKIRVLGYQTIEITSDDDTLISKLAVDISDKVPPMSWTNTKSQNENDEAGNKLPPNPALQSNAPPSADTSDGQTPLYDSNQAGEQGTKQRFNIVADPNENSVTVKFDKPPALDAIDQAVQGQQPQLNPGVTPQNQMPVQNQTQQKQDLSETESPVQF
jgi:hypothetical protein